MADCQQIIESVNQGACPQDQPTAATCLAGNVKNTDMKEAWDKVKNACGEDNTSKSNNDSNKGDDMPLDEEDAETLAQAQKEWAQEMCDVVNAPTQECKDEAEEWAEGLKEALTS